MIDKPTEKGFTILEVLIAVVVLGVSFTVLLGLLHQSKRNLAITQDTFYNFLILNNAVEEGKTTDINITTKKINIMSLQIIERTYEKNGIYIKTYQPK
jgi:prepilin-type N-terminal cleavage/methylation domain-containing protein